MKEPIEGIICGENGDDVYFNFIADGPAGEVHNFIYKHKLRSLRYPTYEEQQKETASRYPPPMPYVSFGRNSKGEITFGTFKIDDQYDEEHKVVRTWVGSGRPEFNTTVILD